MIFSNEIQITFHRHANAQRFFNRLENPWIRKREKALALKLAALYPNATSVLEVGCGEGSNFYFLRPLLPQADFTGIDFSKEKIEFACEFLPDIRFECANALALPFPNASFDFVFCRDLLHHVDFDRQGVLSEMKRVLKLDGLMAVYESRGITPLNLIFQLFYPVERGLCHSSPASLRTLGEQFGQVKIDFAAVSFIIPGIGFILGWPKSNLSRFLCNLIYICASILEKCLIKFIPKTKWAYMLMSVQFEKKNENQYLMDS